MTLSAASEVNQKLIIIIMKLLQFQPFESLFKVERGVSQVKNSKLYNFEKN